MQRTYTQQNDPAVTYRMLPDGAFVAGDLRTGITSYAYPGSTWADEAKSKPELMARQILSEESRALRSMPSVHAYDQRNWKRMEVR
jgi:hypothetical protein